MAITPPEKGQSGQCSTCDPNKCLVIKLLVSSSHISRLSWTFYCLLTSWCAEGGKRNSQITRYSFLPDISARCLVIYQSPITEHYYILPRQASPRLLFRVDLCPLPLIKRLKRNSSAIYRPCRLSAPSSHMKAQYDLKKSVFILNSFRIRVTKMWYHFTLQQQHRARCSCWCLLIWFLYLNLTC